MCFYYLRERKSEVKEMEPLMNYVKPELIAVSVVLYFIGMWLKQAEFVKDKRIPLILGVVGVVIRGVWVFATSQLSTSQEVASAIFAAITQGILVAGASTYVNQIIKQSKKEE